MSIEDQTLSAFLDGELPPAEAARVEAALARDPALAARLEALMAGDELGRMEFDAMLDDPVPDRLAAAIAAAPEPAANTPAAPSRASRLVAASLAGALALGGVGGFLVGQGQQAQVAAASGGWLADIADYHAVYARQVRHLVEVPAAEADHIQVWLTDSVGAPVRIPDLSRHQLTFAGARLLVAAGKPVAQLIYTDPDRRVVALCLIASSAPQDGFRTRVLNSFEMVSWGGAEANFVIVGDDGRGDLDAIARTAATEV